MSSNVYDINTGRKVLSEQVDNNYPLAYYCRPLNIYNTKQELRDIGNINALGYEVIPINTPEIQQAYQNEGMEVFRQLVKMTDALFFRTLPDGSIPAGVYKEIEWADEEGVSIMELPRRIAFRSLSVEETREYLAELGQR